jgi:nucleoside-diphosphate-sugar epimerase
LISELEVLLAQKFNKKYVEARKGESKYAYSAIEKAVDAFSYNPEYSLRQGLIDYIEYEKKLL